MTLGGVEADLAELAAVVVQVAGDEVGGLRAVGAADLGRVAGGNDERERHTPTIVGDVRPKPQQETCAAQSTLTTLGS